MSICGVQLRYQFIITEKKNNRRLRGKPWEPWKPRKVKWDHVPWRDRVGWCLSPWNSLTVQPKLSWNLLWLSLPWSTSSGITNIGGNVYTCFPSNLISVAIQIWKHGCWSTGEQVTVISQLTKSSSLQSIFYGDTWVWTYGWPHRRPSTYNKYT